MTYPALPTRQQPTGREGRKRLSSDPLRHKVRVSKSPDRGTVPNGRWRTRGTGSSHGRNLRVTGEQRRTTFSSGEGRGSWFRLAVHDKPRQPQRPRRRNPDTRDGPFPRGTNKDSHRSTLFRLGIEGTDSLTHRSNSWRRPVVTHSTSIGESSPARYNQILLTCGGRSALPDRGTELKRSG